MPVYHKWQQITELEVAPEVLADDELRIMLGTWREQKGAIDSEALRVFNEKLRREWSVETGLIERIYAFDRGITTMLIERGIDAALIPPHPGQSPGKTAAIIRDHENVADGLFDFVSRRRPITTSYIKALHAALVRNQDTADGVDQFGNKADVPLIKGDYKTRPNNPTRSDGKEHQYCPPEHTAAEMDRLIKINDDYTAKGIAPEVQAAWLHHRFTQIHPFQDGNGRVARCLATLIFIRAGGFPLTIRNINGEREKYLDALETADRGDLRPLISVFVAAQRREVTRAIGISREMVGEDAAPLDDDYQSRTASIIKVAAQTLSARQDKQKQEWGNARNIARAMHQLSFDMLNQVQAELDKNIPAHGITDAFRVDAHPSHDTEDRGHYFRYQIIEVAKKFGYFVNLGLYHEWARLTLRPGGRAELLVSFHGTGNIYRGLLVCSASMFRRERTDAEDRQVSPAEELTDEVFQINYQDSEERVMARFRPWLGKALERGLAYWQKSL